MDTQFSLREIGFVFLIILAVSFFFPTVALVGAVGLIIIVVWKMLRFF